MKRYTVAHVRERLADVLNEADRGVEVVIERRGVRYVLRAEKGAPRRTTRQPRIEILDPAVEAGQWTWAWTPNGLKFKGTRRP